MTINDLRLIREGVNLKWKFWLKPWKLRKEMNSLCDALESAWQNELQSKKESDTSQAELLKATKALNALTQWVHTTHRLTSLPGDGPLKKMFGLGARQ